MNETAADCDKPTVALCAVDWRGVHTAPTAHRPVAFTEAALECVCVCVRVPSLKQQQQQLHLFLRMRITNYIVYLFFF